MRYDIDDLDDWSGASEPPYPDDQPHRSSSGGTFARQRAGRRDRRWSARLHAGMAPPLLVWNASSSSPVGLYALTSSADARPGEMVVAWPPRTARALAAERHYLPADVPLVKRVAAAAGDRICAIRNAIFVNGRMAAVQWARDRAGRPMPSWSGCKVLQAGELFLLSEGVPQAFDGRYFGMTRSTDVLGKARLPWARPAKGSLDG